MPQPSAEMLTHKQVENGSASMATQILKQYFSRVCGRRHLPPSRWFSAPALTTAMAAPQPESRVLRESCQAPRAPAPHVFHALTLLSPLVPYFLPTLSSSFITSVENQGPLP